MAGWGGRQAGREGAAPIRQIHQYSVGRLTAGNSSTTGNSSIACMAATHDSKNGLPHEAGLCMCR